MSLDKLEVLWILLILNLAGSQLEVLLLMPFFGGMRMFRLLLLSSRFAAILAGS
jgi:hypothetical protein